MLSGTLVLILLVLLAVLFLVMGVRVVQARAMSTPSNGWASTPCLPQTPGCT